MSEANNTHQADKAHNEEFDNLFVDLRSRRVKKRKLSSFSKGLIKVAYLTLTLIFWEVMMHLLAYQTISASILYPIFFSVAGGLLLFLISELFPRKVNIAATSSILAILFLFFCVQHIYRTIFGSFMEISLIGMGGTAITSFFKETVNAILSQLNVLLLFALPFPILVILTKLKLISFQRRNAKDSLLLLPVNVFAYILCLLCLFVGGKGNYSAYDCFFGTQVVTDSSIQKLGLLPTATAEIKYFISPEGEETDISLETEMNIVIFDDDMSSLINDIINEERNEAGTEPDGESETETEKGPVIDTSLNILDEIDFSRLNSLTDDSALQKLNTYFDDVVGTRKNEYTGIFKGYNLIEICAESFSPYLISEEYTPTLYKLSHEGIIFNNFYNSYPNTTTDGEYTLCMGIFPDLSRHKSDGSFKYSSDNLVPLCLGNMFTSMGVNSYGYHNYLGSYYSRATSHVNMGYSFKSMNNGMKFTTSWPSSDLEMFEQSVDDYIDLEQFHAYYMTFSGHYEYDNDLNPMCARNRKAVADMDASRAVKAYIACNLELEKALTYLMDKLEEYNKLENTVIVLTADHYPYGLSDKEYNELAGFKVDTTFEKYRNAFICWNGGLEEPIVNDNYCCTVDILPTILNLFGMEYDSRLLIGRDAFSTSEKIVILKNQSFITDLLKYDSNSGDVTYLVDETRVPSWYLDSKIAEVKNKLNISTMILNEDYYRFVYDNSFTTPESETDSE